MNGEHLSSPRVPKERNPFVISESLRRAITYLPSRSLSFIKEYKPAMIGLGLIALNLSIPLFGERGDHLTYFTGLGLFIYGAMRPSSRSK